MKNSKRAALTALIPIVLIILFAIIMGRAKSTDDALIVYCSHDSIFADDILKKFTEKTGIKVIPRYDTEASKSLGLTEKILIEAENSDCDVYWSNEIFSMPVLQEKGLLASYKGPGWNRIPDKFKDKEGMWTGFAARLRVIIINTEKVQDEEKVKGLFEQGDLTKTAIALPLYGTTLTHFACLWRELGKEKLEEIYKAWKERGIQIVPGNGPVRNLVANGTCDFGWTDTDDYYGAVDKNAPVKMLPVRLKDNSTICIPNTVGMIKHSKQKEKARKLIDFLLSESTEIALAKSSSRQIPLGKVNEKLPEQVKVLIPFAEQGTDLSDLISIRSDLINWIKEIENLK